MADTDVAQPPHFPMARAAECPFAPAPKVRELAERKPLNRVTIWDGSTPWLVTGHAELRTLFADPRVSVDDSQPGFPHWNEGMAAIAPHRPRSVFNADPPEHTRYRRVLTRGFTAKRVQALRPAIQKITDDLLDTIMAGTQPADLVAELALPLPSLMISELLGVPYEDHEFFQQNATTGVDRYSSSDQQMQSFAELTEYLIRMLEAKMADPGEDVISDLAERVQAEELTMHEAAQLGTGTLVAGHETSANMIALGVLALLQNPEQLALFRDSDDDATVASAVEEMLRYLTIIHNGQRRVALEDIEIGGEVIRAGEGIINDVSAANWDASVFAEPEQLDLHRQTRQHMAFGFGPHQCVGQQLARVELQVVYSTLAKRMPNLALAVPIEEIEFKDDRLAYGVYTLPVTW